MDATISEPFILSSYSIFQRLSTTASGKTSRTLSNAYATHENGGGSSDGYVTVAAQGDGVHVLDVSTLHPVISHSLGPSATFSCPAITRRTLDGTKTVFSTYAVMNSSSDILPDESGRTVWVWKEDLASSLADRAAASQNKKSIVVPSSVSGLYISEDLPSRLLLMSPNGDIIVTDAELNVQYKRESSDESRLLRKTFVFSRKSCPFVPAQSPHGAILILIKSSRFDTWLQILVVGPEEGFVELGECRIPIKPDEISDISCSTSGYLSVLAHDGSWSSFQLGSTNGTSINLSLVAETIRLNSISFIFSPNSCDEVSLLSLGSSHVLLAGITKNSTREISLLLWDLQYSVLLASQTLPIPPSTGDSTIKLNLVTGNASQALLVLTPILPSYDKSKASITSPSLRTSILIIPFTVPATSTIANAIGRASSGARWLAQPDTSSSSVFPNHSTHDPARMKLLDTMRKAMEQNRPQAANAAFFEWEKREKDAHRKAETGDSEVVKGGTSTYNENPLSDSQLVLGYSFVKDLVTTILQPSKSSNVLYSSEVLRYLLSRKVISANMVDGLLAVLQSRNDWKSMEIVLENVLDVPETDIISILRCVVVRHRQELAASSRDKDAMQIDASPTDMPSLPSFLSRCVRYPTSPAALRLAIRDHLQDADDILCILGVLERWIASWSKKEVRLLPPKKSISKNEHGVLVTKPRGKGDKGDLPPLTKVLSFLQTLIDASYLNMLQHPPTFRVLRNIFEHVEPEVSLIDQMEQLRGPLEPFAKAQAKAIKEGSEGRQKEPHGDWRQRRKQIHDQAGLAIGLYRLEELVL